MLEDAGVPYDDVRYFGGNEGVRADWAGRSPIAKLPIYSGPELGEGVYLAQSRAILRHLGRHINGGALLGEGAAEQVRLPSPMWRPLPSPAQHARRLTCSPMLRCSGALRHDL